MEFHSTTRQVSCAFRNLQLKRIKRTEKKGQESVMDEKFAVLFWTDFQVGELKFQLWTFSLPVVVIVHGNQESQALSTIVWDNGFGDWGRNAFVVAEKVPWKKMGEVLSMKWQAACGAGLTEENLYFLACKALRNNNLSRNEYNKVPISWQYFCKELLPDRTFTFWEWFYRAMELTQLRLMNLWKDRHIMGFVDKGAATQILMAKSAGSFLLRFSDSELGGITIAFKQQTNFGEFSVESLFPFSKRDLEQRSMAEIVFDIDNLLYVVGSSHSEEISKDKLKNYLVPSPRPNEAAGKCNPGYIKTVFKTHMEGGGPNPGFVNINSQHRQLSMTTVPPVAASYVPKTEQAVKSELPPTPPPRPALPSRPQQLSSPHHLHPDGSPPAPQPPDTTMRNQELQSFSSAVTQSIQLDYKMN